MPRNILIGHQYKAHGTGQVEAADGQEKSYTDVSAKMHSEGLNWGLDEGLEEGPEEGLGASHKALRKVEDLGVSWPTNALTQLDLQADEEKTIDAEIWSETEILNPHQDVSDFWSDYSRGISNHFRPPFLMSCEQIFLRRITLESVSEFYIFILNKQDFTK
jgi:hypothetical protein